MKRFEITIDGIAQAGDFATREEAEVRAAASRTDGRRVEVRERDDGRAAAQPQRQPATTVAVTGKKGEPVYDKNGTLVGNAPAGTSDIGRGFAQGTPGNPAGREQR